MLAAAREAGVKRFVHVSTEAVLADGGPLRHVDETAPYPKGTRGSTPAPRRSQSSSCSRRTRPEMRTGAIVRPRLVWGRGRHDAGAHADPRGGAAGAAGRWVGGGRLPRRRRATCGTSAEGMRVRRRARARAAQIVLPHRRRSRAVPRLHHPAGGGARRGDAGPQHPLPGRQDRGRRGGPRLAGAPPQGRAAGQRGRWRWPSAVTRSPSTTSRPARS